MKNLTKDRKEKLRKIQKNIAERVILKDDFPRPIKTIAGFDLSFKDDLAFVAGVVLDYKTLEIREIKCIKTNLTFPYIPTFLAFREGPPITEVYDELETNPDIIMIDGHGLIHPRRVGIACHVGVLLDKPAIGVAKNLLCGRFKKVKGVGDSSPVIHEKRTVGYAYKSKKDCKPIFVSPGHKVSLKASLKIVKECTGNHKLPEPLWLAHLHVNKMKKIS